MAENIEKLEDAISNANAHCKDIAEFWKEYHNAEDKGEDTDDIVKNIFDSPLSVEVRSDWHTPGDEASSKPVEYRILLTWGGPGLRITGYLNQNQQAYNACLEVQEWFTKWTKVDEKTKGMTDYNEEQLLWFAEFFYFGE